MTPKQGTPSEDSKLFQDTVRSLKEGRGHTPKDDTDKKHSTAPRVGRRRPARKAVTDKPADGTLKRFFRDGVQEAAFAKWRRRSRTEAKAELDLHGKLRDEVREAVERFINESLRDGQQSVLIIHGRGQRSADGPVLPEETRRCLQRTHTVKGYDTDPAGGAITVWLKRRRPR